MSWWDKVDRWWQTGHGLRAPSTLASYRSALVPANLTSYRVVLRDSPDATVKAEAVDTTGGELRFLVAGKVVASWPQSEVVGWSTSP